MHSFNWLIYIYYVLTISRTMHWRIYTYTCMHTHTHTHTQISAHKGLTITSFIHLLIWPAQIKHFFYPRHGTRQYKVVENFGLFQSRKTLCWLQPNQVPPSTSLPPSVCRCCFLCSRYFTKTLQAVSEIIDDIRLLHKCPMGWSNLSTLISLYKCDYLME